HKAMVHVPAYTSAVMVAAHQYPPARHICQPRPNVKEVERHIAAVYYQVILANKPLAGFGNQSIHVGWAARVCLYGCVPQVRVKQYPSAHTRHHDKSPHSCRCSHTPYGINSSSWLIGNPARGSYATQILTMAPAQCFVP